MFPRQPRLCSTDTSGQTSICRTLTSRMFRRSARSSTRASSRVPSISSTLSSRSPATTESSSSKLKIPDGTTLTSFLMPPPLRIASTASNGFATSMYRRATNRRVSSPPPRSSTTTSRRSGWTVSPRSRSSLWRPYQSYCLPNSSSLFRPASPA